MAYDDEWYYAQHGQRIGPVSLAAVQSLLSRGALTPADLVWTNGMADWSPAGTIPELSAATVGTAYVAPHPQPPAYGYPSQYLPQGQPTATVGYYTPPAMGGFPVALPYAGFWLRFVALLLDGLILWAMVTGVIGMVLAVLVAASGPRRGPAGLSGVMALPLLADLVLAVVAFLYFTLQESGSRQATWGKRTVGLIVTNEAGGRISYGQAVGRFFGKWVSAMIFYVGFMMAGWTARKQALHDMMAGTLVMRRA